MIREEKDRFSEENHMKEQEKVRITAKAEVRVEEEEEQIFNQE